MEFKLKNSFKCYPKDDNSKEVQSITLDDKKFNIARVQRDLAIHMNAIALKMFSSINSTNTNTDEKIEVKEKTYEESLAEYKAIGFNLFSFLEDNKLELILKTMIDNGCIYHEKDNDLSKNDKFIDSLDIVDIYTILGYYFINFTAKQLV